METSSCGLSALTIPKRKKWKKCVGSYLFCNSPYLLSLWITFSLCLRTASGLSCHCLDRNLCKLPIKDCAGECEPGWYGPGCQIGNLALQKLAIQSTTYGVYTADFAVNGVMPQLGDETENNCSHTQEDPNVSHWWFVTLSASEDFVLKNISIVNRQGHTSSQLQDFYILYTKDITGLPNLTTWTLCKYQKYVLTTVVTTFTCGTTAIGRHVAIYFDNRSRPYKRLMLCEVYVDGYPYTDTVILNDLQVLRANYGDIITGNIDNIKPVVPYSFLVFFLNSTEDEFRIPIATSGRNFSVTVSDMANVTYSVSAAPATCCYESKCPIQNTDIATFNYDKCVIGQSTHLFVLDPGQNFDSSSPTTSETLKTITAASVGGAVACTALVTGIILTLLLIQRRKTNTRKKITKREQDTVGNKATHINDAYIDEEDPIYDNTIGMDLAEFESYSRNERSILDKFMELRFNEGQVHEQGLLHKKKNRFKDIVPYDINRVILKLGSNDYINASYISGFKRKNKYIATQGPTSDTIADFWNMVWQENVTIIVMLTPYIEGSKSKCKPYFPIKDRDKYGILVDVKSQNSFDTHMVSILNVTFKEESKIVYHLHLLAWPDRSVPEHVGDLIMFLAKVRKTVFAQRSQRRPIVVHCSAGVGRTGAYIALDYLLDRYLAERRVDVDSCVVGLRDQRMHMVQTKEQYAFIHTALLYGMKTLGFVRDMEDLNNLSENCGVHNDYRLAEEWKCLQVADDGPTFPLSYYATALLSENKLKNRHPGILASEEKRPILGGLQGPSQTYINAVFCNGCYANNAFIATQWPLNETVSDFWELVYDCSPGCIILLHHSPSPQEYPAFVPPPGTSISAGAFKVKSLSSSRDQESGINEQELSVRLISNRVGPKASSLTVRLLELDLFALDSQVPPDFQQTAKSIVHLLPQCKRSSRQCPNIVVCKDGATYCGLFLAAANSLHRMLESGHVNVFHTVDVLRASRSQFVSTQAQYNYLYQLLKYYIATKSTADNT